MLGRLLMNVPGAIFGSAKWGRVDADPYEYARGLDSEASCGSMPRSWARVAHDCS